MDKRLNLPALQDAMERKGLNASSLADALTVSREATSKWLRGDSFPRPDKLLKLSLTLGLGFNDLVIRETDEHAPVVAFRKRGATKITEEHVAHAREIGRLLRHLVPYLPFDRFLLPPTLKEPSTDYRYLQDLARQIRREIGLRDGEVLDFHHLIKRFSHLQAVLVPVLWGLKDKHENALHIFLPDSMTTWVYLNLDVEVHDFKFWMAHELGHVMAPALRGDEAEDFADRFAGALLFPEPLTGAAYQEVAGSGHKGAQMNRVKEIAERNVISPVTVYYEMNHYAEANGLPEIKLGSAIFGAAKNLSKDYLSLSQTMFGNEHPQAADYLERAAELFDTPVFEAIGTYLREQGKGPGYLQAILDISLLDARELHAALS